MPVIRPCLRVRVNGFLLPMCDASVEPGESVEFRPMIIAGNRRHSHTGHGAAVGEAGRAAVAHLDLLPDSGRLRFAWDFGFTFSRVSVILCRL